MVPDRGCYLFDEPKGFRMCPDMVLTDQDTGEIKIFDIKWKMLSPWRSHYGITQGDMYQMYAYQKKYKAKKAVLIYPYNFAMENYRDQLLFSARDQACVEEFLFDLSDTEGSLQRLRRIARIEPERSEFLVVS